MRYLSLSDIHFPPHLSPPLPTSVLSSQGFEPQVIALLQHLPFLRNIERQLGPTLDFESYGINYLSQDEASSARDALNQGENDIAPWALRITNGSPDGTNYIYDTRDCKSRLYTLP